jgi:hypothetical protein
MFKTLKRFIEGIAKGGLIGLQDHGCAIRLRTLKSREL